MPEACGFTQTILINSEQQNILRPMITKGNPKSGMLLLALKIEKLINQMKISLNLKDQF